MCVGSVGDGGGGVANGSGVNGDSDGASSRFELDSGNSDNSETDDDGDDDDDGPLRFVVKRSNALTVVETRRLRFPDITNFIAPGFSYERYLKVYSCELIKGTFPTSGWIHRRS